jgi:signal transduction histidine kinase
MDDLPQDRRHGLAPSGPGTPQAALPVRSDLVVPVVSPSGETLGTVFLGHQQAGVFTATHERLAVGVAQWAALALDNARRYRIAQDASLAKDAFLATVSHELRNPLNAILGWLQVLQQSTAPAPEVHARALAALERSARAQRKLIDDLLDVSRIVSGKLRIKFDEVDLTDVVSGAADEIRPSASANGVELILTMDPSSEVLASGDEDRLGQIVRNLLSNAVKFTPPGGRIDVALRLVAQTAYIVVTDTGCGISREFLPRVFERCQQDDGSAARRHGGLGLGLAIVRHLVEAHGGSVHAASRGLGEGSSFTVRLPLRSVRTRVDAASTVARP